MEAAQSGQASIFSFICQVVGGLLKNKTFAESIGGLWNNNEVYDLNDSLTTGLYVARANNETDNSPSQDSCLVAVLSDANYSMQLAVTLNLDNIYFRRIVKYTQRYGKWIILIKLCYQSGAVFPIKLK